MYAVEKLSSYITRGVYTVSGPFHPFGGAVDIIVVQQQDGSFKSSPWYVRFGKFQGVLKTKERTVNICVNGVEAGFHMYLDHKGEAYFLKDSDTNEGDFVISPPSSGDEVDEQMQNVRFKKAQSCNYDGIQRDPAAPVESGNGKIVSRTSSRRSGIFSLMFGGRRSMKENVKGTNVDRVSSLERAEIAADLLEVKWSTNLPANNLRVDNSVENLWKEKDMEVSIADSEMISSHSGADDNLGTSTVNREPFEGRIIHNSPSVTGDRVLLGSSLSETSVITDRNELVSNETSIRTDEADIMLKESVIGNPIGDNSIIGLSTDGTFHESIDSCDNKFGDNSGTNMVTEVHFEEAITYKETVTRSSCFETQEEILEIYTVETEDLANGNEVLSKSGMTEDADCNVSSKGCNLKNPTAYVQCPDSACPFRDTDHAGGEKDHAGGEKDSFGQFEAVKSSTVTVGFDVPNDQAHDTSNLSNEGGGQAGECSEVPCGTAELICDTNSPLESCGFSGKENHSDCCSENLYLSKGSFLFQNSMDNFPSNGAFQDTDTNGFNGKSSLRYCSSPNLHLPGSESEVIYLDGGTDKLSQEIETITKSIEFGVNQSQMRGGKPIEATSHVPVLNEKSKLKNIHSFPDSSNSDESVQELVSRRKGVSMEEYCPSNVGKIAQDESELPSSENLEDVQFLFSDIDNFDAKETDPDVSLDVIVEETDTNNELDDKDHEESLESSSEVSRTQTSPADIPRSKTHSGETELLALSLPIIRSHIHDLDRSNPLHPLSCSLDLGSDNYEHDLLRKKTSSSLKLEGDSEGNVIENNGMSEAVCTTVDAGNKREQKGSPINPTVELSLCRHLLFEGMGTDAACKTFNAEKVNLEKFSALGPSLVKNDRLVVRIEGRYFPWDAAAPIILGMVSFGQEHIFEPRGMIAVDRDEKDHTGNASRAIIPSGGSWRLWPFNFKKSKTISTVLSASESINRVNADAAPIRSQSMVTDDDIQKGKFTRKKVRSLTPTSEELASLNLKEGRNVITFSFSTAMLGQQQVDARIYLWKWNTQIVISDVDGTITKSDVLGQFMPMVGIDWSQTGVAHLFSAIKENGYQLLFLSARAISQAYLTRQFLFNLKQDGKALPDGPVVISPDGLFPSLFREVIRRAPHEFKIACLEDIRALFPLECNPFYAGFGNRDTDEISYLKVGIPKGKIFIINPKGEVAVNHRVDTKSYTSLHTLVNGMFPPVSSSEQEEYNSWNYWKLPLPDVDI